MPRELFDALAEAREQQAWSVVYSDDTGQHTIIMFGDTEEEVRDEFERLTDPRNLEPLIEGQERLQQDRKVAELESVNEWA